MRAMRRTTPLAATALLGLALVAPTVAASAAEVTCQGSTATLVGTGPTVTGTEGRDVIVTGPASTVDALGGDDLICVRPVEGSTILEIDAGAGDDSVVSETGTNISFVDLGPGRDSFVSGNGEDRVTASFDDTIAADRGTDLVTYVLAPDEALPTTVGSLSGSRTAVLAVRVVAPGRRITIDARARNVRVSQQVVTTIGVVPRIFHAVAQHVTLIGTPGPDRLAATACASASVRGRGGDDEILRDGDGAPPRRECRHSHMLASGGAGDDRIAGTVNNDVLRGGRGNDVLTGRRGKDVARGGPGRDTCRAERSSSCER